MLVKSKGTLESECKDCSKVKAAIRQKNWRKNNTAKVKLDSITWKLRRSDPLFRAIFVYQDARKNDKQKGRDNDLTRKFVENVISRPCSYCGDDENRMTLDRIDNSLGHLQNNVVGSCVRCNMIKGQMPYDAWKVIAPAVKSARLSGLFLDWTGDLRRII